MSERRDCSPPSAARWTSAPRRPAPRSPTTTPFRDKAELEVRNWVEVRQRNDIKNICFSNSKFSFKNDVLLVKCKHPLLKHICSQVLEFRTISETITLVHQSRCENSATYYLMQVSNTWKNNTLIYYTTSQTLLLCHVCLMLCNWQSPSHEGLMPSWVCYSPSS